jgi:hypothetical protein
MEIKGETASTFQHLHFRLTASWIVREYIYVVSSHQLYGNLLWQPYEIKLGNLVNMKKGSFLKKIDFDL